MEHFEKVALRTAENPPRLWKQFVNGTITIQHTENKETFLYHIKNIGQVSNSQKRIQGKIDPCHS